VLVMTIQVTMPATTKMAPKTIPTFEAVLRMLSPFTVAAV
jgi:hypothetical protein